MDDWNTLCDAPYDENHCWSVFLAWTESRRRTSEWSDLQEAFLKASMPLFGSQFRGRFQKLQSADREDVCSIISIRFLDKVWRHREKLLEKQRTSGFTAYLMTIVRNHIFDYFRKDVEPEQTFDLELFYRRPQVTIPKQVELHLTLDELPERIAEFAVKRDRFSFGKKVILFVSRCLVSGKRIHPDTLRSWWDVDNPEVCISFVTLMGRWYLHKFKDKFYPILDGEVVEHLVGVDQNCHVL